MTPDGGRQGSRTIGHRDPGDVTPTRTVNPIGSGTGDTRKVGTSGKGLRRVDDTTPIGGGASRHIGGSTGQPGTIAVDPTGGGINRGGKTIDRYQRTDRWNGFRPNRRGWYDDHPNRWRNNYWGYYGAFCNGYGFGWNYCGPCYGFGLWGGTGFGLYGCLNWGIGYGYSTWGWNCYRRWNNWWWYPRHCYFGYASLPVFGYYLSYPYSSSYVVDSSPEIIYVDSGSPTIVIYEDDDLDRWIADDVAPVRGGEAAAPAPADAVPSLPRPSSELSLAEKYLKLGDLYFRAGRFSEAADAYARAIELAPGEGALHMILSDALFATGDYHAAAQAIRRALEKDPNLAKSRADKREFYADPAVFAEHMERLESFTKDFPEDADGMLVLGYNRLFSNDVTGAKPALEAARRLTIGSVDAAQLLLDSALDRLLEEAESTRSQKAPAGKID